MSSIPTLRWGIIGTGFISTWFVDDILLERKDRKANHVIQAIGASSKEKGQSFLAKYNKKLNKGTYIGTYNDIYSHNEVDIVYIGLPHVFHKESALKAIEQGKHVLLEKPAGVNAEELKELVLAAKWHNVFLMEGVWLRFRPIILELQQLILKDKILGEIYRLFSDFSMDMKLDSLSDNSRLKSNSLGAGALLDIGIYSLTYARLFLDNQLGENHTPFEVKCFQTVKNGIDYMTSAIISYSNGKQAIITNSVYNQTPETFFRLEGELGCLLISGSGSIPTSYKIEFKDNEKEPIQKSFPIKGIHGLGFHYEADAIALDIEMGKIENELIPWDESILVLETMDDMRKQGGVSYPQDVL
ncbi:unnamed protein product [Debaryomyces tyrocola]|nr:unnamed protein product [Debaryomyces tyrocola]